MKLFDRLIDHVVDRVMARAKHNRNSRAIKVNGRGINFAAEALALAGEEAGRKLGESLGKGQATVKSVEELEGQMRHRRDRPA